MTKTEHPPVREFKGPFRYLSNFYERDVVICKVPFRSTEHAYQASKTMKRDWIRKIQDAETPKEAKKLGRKAPLIPWWEEIKLKVMLGIVREKFRQHRDLALKLISTEKAVLQEGNTWGDDFWGMVDGQGKNHLGRTLMTVRFELQTNKLVPLNGSNTVCKCGHDKSDHDSYGQCEYAKGFNCECGKYKQKNK